MSLKSKILANSLLFVVNHPDVIEDLEKRDNDVYSTLKNIQLEVLDENDNTVYLRQRFNFKSIPEGRNIQNGDLIIDSSYSPDIGFRLLKKYTV